MRLILLSVFALFLNANAQAGPYVIDLSSQSRYTGTAPLARHQAALCSLDGGSTTVRGRTVRVLAAAVVVFSRHRWRSLWGHIGVRFLVCDGETLSDVQFEYYRYSDVTEANLASLYPEESFPLDQDYAHSLIGQLVLHRREPEVDRGFFAEQIDRNREAYVLWLDLNHAQTSTLYRMNEDRYTAQLARLKSKQTLERVYRPMSDNCTFHLQRDMSDFPSFFEDNRKKGSIFPFWYLRQLERGPVWLKVMHPSVHAWHRLGEKNGWPDAVQRLHPWKRNYRSVPEQVFPDEAPVPRIVTALLAREESQR